MSVISREIISDNFLGINLPSGVEYNKEQLCEQIDKWKYYLVNECGARKGHRILVGVVNININFLALCFACFELSLVIVIADENPIRIVAGNKIVNPKIANFMPLDILVWSQTPKTNNLDSNDFVLRKFQFFRNNCKKYCTVADFYDYQFPENLEEVSKIRPAGDDILMITSSSGSTGTAKVIEHKHNFFFELCSRNASQFKGNVAHVRNMHHGSSLSVFYLPSLISNQVAKHYFVNFSIDTIEEFVLKIADLKLNHLSLPYASYVSKFYSSLEEQNVKLPDLKLSILTYISSESKKYIQEGYIKEVESIFGSNETGGPVFLSTLNRDNLTDYDSKQFYKPDNFYGICLEENNLEVSLPVYDTVIRTNDLFGFENNVYTHLGRSDLLRINDVQIDLKTLDIICERYQDLVMLITDTVENKIYLLLQKDSYLDTDKEYGVKKLVKNINARLFDAFNSDRISVDKYLVEDFSKFISGIKLDRELIREYFRNHV